VYGELKFRRRSRFLDEMPAAELEEVGARSSRPAPPPSYGRYAPSGYGEGRPRSHAPLRPSKAGSDLEPRVDRSDAYEVDGVELRRGMAVRHAKFGVGHVLAVTAGSPPRVTVSFPGWGDKTLVSSYLEPA
jgi:hypothetical protein